MLSFIFFICVRSAEDSASFCGRSFHVALHINDVDNGDNERSADVHFKI